MKNPKIAEVLDMLFYLIGKKIIFYSETQEKDAISGTLTNPEITKYIFQK